ncbi:hypothetical protein AB1287_10310 [Enterobacter asburiae]|uniref:hypothetical protein n=1 Tax=Scandinavium sp. UTDF21-P1B TaxID=3446379 RepID=UPI00349A51DF
MTSQLTPEQLRNSTQRKHHNWNKAVMRSCDFCGLHASTITVDLMAMCASCCDARYTSHLSTMVEMAADALEARDKRIADLVRANAAQDDHINQQQNRIDSFEKVINEAARQINSWRKLAKQNIAEREKDLSELDMARKRIAGLESRAESAEQALKSRQAPVGDLVMLIKVLVRGLKKTGLNSELCESAMDYLKRQKLISASDCLRSDAGISLQKGDE